nr:response regulator [Desulfobulbaceae bacterium]
MKKVLVVEDDFFSRQLLIELLSDHFDTLHMAVNGKEAVEAFIRSVEEDKHYDLICLDIMMPELNGQEALQEIRRIEKEKGIGGADMVKVIMTTALNGPKDIMGAFIKGGCEGYLTKPIDLVKLNEYLKKFGLYREKKTVR